MEEKLEIDGSGVFHVLNTEVNAKIVSCEGDGICQRCRVVPTVLIFGQQL